MTNTHYATALTGIAIIVLAFLNLAGVIAWSWIGFVIALTFVILGLLLLIWSDISAGLISYRSSTITKASFRCAYCGRQRNRYSDNKACAGCGATQIVTAQE